MTPNQEQPQGYPRLDLNFVQPQLVHSSIGHTLVYHSSIPSTMTVAAELAQDPATPSGLVVVAEEQTGGRGRHGRTWNAPHASALLMSAILKPPHIPFPIATLAMIAGNALVAAISAAVPELAGELHLKWPNDLLIGRDPANAAKVAGILSESSLNPDRTATYVILGIGINVNQVISDLPQLSPPAPRPTSLRIARSEIGNPESLIDRGYLLVHLCQQLAIALETPPAETYRRWKDHLSTLNHPVTVYEQGVERPPTLAGQAVDVREDGALVVVDDAGTRHTFHAADVSIRAT
jgi:BirA family biotin operon repressor/biotin-[acetyl-CoA-carboxylase] ligase